VGRAEDKRQSARDTAAQHGLRAAVPHYLEAAQALVDARRAEEAVDLLGELLTAQERKKGLFAKVEKNPLGPARAQAALKFAEISRQSVPTEDVLELLQEIALEFPDEPAIRRSNADALYSAGYIADASEEYRYCLHLNPEDGQILTRLTEAYAEMGRNDHAIEYLRRGMRVHAEAGDYGQAMHLAIRWLGMTPGAADDVLRLLRDWPADALRRQVGGINQLAMLAKKDDALPAAWHKQVASEFAQLGASGRPDQAAAIADARPAEKTSAAAPPPAAGAKPAPVEQPKVPLEQPKAPVIATPTSPKPIVSPAPVQMKPPTVAPQPAAPVRPAAATPVQPPQMPQPKPMSPPKPQPEPAAQPQQTPQRPAAAAPVQATKPPVVQPSKPPTVSPAQPIAGTPPQRQTQAAAQAAAEVKSAAPVRPQPTSSSLPTLDKVIEEADRKPTEAPRPPARPTEAPVPPADQVPGAQPAQPAAADSRAAQPGGAAGGIKNFARRKARELYDAGDYAGASQSLERVARFGADSETLHMLLRCYTELKQPEDAKRVALQLADLEVEAGNAKEAIKALNDLAKWAPDPEVLKKLESAGSAK